MAILYVSDLDGTLLNEQAKISTESVEILNDLIEQGLAFTIATARTHLSALPILSDLNVTLPMVLLNGCMLFDPKERRLIEYTAFSKSATKALREAETLAALAGLLLTVKNGELELHVGNAQNDLPMFEVCTESYAVENACEEVGKAALASIGKNTESSVAHFIRKHFAERNSGESRI